ncbi:hypothetical protein [Caulobacter hibisci]|uniref:Uncharacterized protein n=1 Tax=Caulobacter hibisci TaxID=2035993 RepID=A0ABS0STP8_9CAUL|nr:hypothetical protein [Caulobacter hibisci]MBI1682884.1 hypothetical protein [Caulobacter hibisci]
MTTSASTRRTPRSANQSQSAPSSSSPTPPSAMAGRYIQIGDQAMLAWLEIGRSAPAYAVADDLFAEQGDYHRAVLGVDPTDDKAFEGKVALGAGTKDGITIAVQRHGLAP